MPKPRWGCCTKTLDLRATKTRLGYVECTHKEVSKLKSIDIALSKKGLVSRENIMAIGDGYNDIEMLKGAKLGVAMGNAVEEVKKI
ncbi:MAG: HAD-IIB family hydrolase, partial [Pseudomonadota bacterium]